MNTYYDKEAKLWTGPDPLPLPNPNISLGEVLLNSLAKFAPKIAQVHNNNWIIFNSLENEPIEILFFR